jgi:hypothetical protein
LGAKLVLTLRGLRVFENRELRTIFGPKRRKLHNEELRDLSWSGSA